MLKRSMIGIAATLWLTTMAGFVIPAIQAQPAGLLQLKVQDDLGATVGLVMGAEKFPFGRFVVEVAMLDDATDTWIELALTREGFFDTTVDLGWESLDCTGTPYVLDGPEQPEDLLMPEAEWGFGDVFYYRIGPLVLDVQIQSRQAFLPNTPPGPCLPLTVTIDTREMQQLDVSGLFTPPFRIE